MDEVSFLTNVARIRHEKPLILNLTNYVVMNTTANALLALGASPIMSCSERELEDILNISKALVVNIGTLDDSFIDLIDKAISLAKSKNIPIVFDPVGSGASQLRTQVSRNIVLNYKPSVIRGNASEIMSLFDDDAKSKGVDSILSPQDAHNAAKKMARELEATIVISGKHDYVTNGEHSFIFRNGHEMMSRITGMGCISTAITGAFFSTENTYKSALEAVALMGVIGEEAAQISNGVGSMHVHFLDLLYNFDAKEVFQKIRYEKI